MGIVHGDGPDGSRYRTFEVSQASAFGGMQCNHKNGNVDDRECNTDTPCPID